MHSVMNCLPSLLTVSPHADEIRAGAVKKRTGPQASEPPMVS